MPEHSYRCTCGERTRVLFSLQQYPFPETLPCRCGGQLVRFFERAPGIAPDIWAPYYDQQLGAVVTSRAQRAALAKSKGFDEILGVEEYERSRKAHVPKDEFSFSAADKEAFRDSADKAMNDLKYGNVPVPEMPTLEAVDTPTAIGVESGKEGL